MGGYIGTGMVLVLYGIKR